MYIHVMIFAFKVILVSGPLVMKDESGRLIFVKN